MSVADKFLAAAAELVPALEAETEALRAFDLTRLPACLEAKEKAANRYAEQVAAVRAEIAKGTLAPEAREKLKVVVSRIDVAGARNAIALQAATTAHRKVVDVIARAAERRAGRVAGYGRSGRVAEAPRGARPAASLLHSQVA
jgi:signal transduction protein with GAF and PtsI domain